MSHLWRQERWKKHIDVTARDYKSGLRMHYEEGVNSEVREQIDCFAKWVRKEFAFPLRVNVYVKESRRITAKDGDFVVGTLWRPLCYNDFPYIRLATGDYPELVAERGEVRAIIAILHTFAHELSHYYQHINKLNLTDIGEERQATRYANDIIKAYIKDSGYV